VNELDTKKAIKRLFEAHGFDDYVRSKAPVLIDSKIVAEEAFEIGKYKRRHCSHLNGDRCEVWIRTATKEHISPSVARCALCWLYKER